MHPFDKHVLHHCEKNLHRRRVVWENGLLEKKYFLNTFNNK